MTRKERSENAKRERMDIVRTFVKALGKGGVSEAQTALVAMKRQTPQRAGQFELAFHTAVEANIQRGQIKASLVPLLP